jgi:hypothetical protein
MHMLRAVLVVFALATAACGGRAQSAIDWEHKAPFQRGTVLRHVPAECGGGHLFLDLPAVAKNEATRAAVDVLTERFFAGMASTPGDHHVIDALHKALRDEGLDPARDTKEIAICYRGGDGGMIAVFGGDFSGKDVFGAVSKAATKLGDKPPDIFEKKGLEYMKLGTLRVVRVAPNVVALGEDLSALLMLGEPADRSELWGFRPDHAGFAHIGGADEIFIAFADRGAEVEVELIVRTAGKDLSSRRDGVADRLETTALKALAPAVRTAKIQTNGPAARIVLRGGTPEIAEAIRVAASLSAAELKKIVGFVFGGADAAPEHKI